VIDGCRHKVEMIGFNRVKGVVGKGICKGNAVSSNSNEYAVSIGGHTSV